MDLTYINQIENSEIEELIDLANDSLKISLVMPIQQETDKREENRIRLKNLLKEAYNTLDSLNYREPDAREILAPVEDFIDGGDYLELSRQGLAIYLSDGFIRSFLLPHAPQQEAVVGSHFYIKPLMPLRRPETFFILVLSQQDVRLLHVHRNDAERLSLENMPQSLNEALRWDDPERELQWHSQTGRLTDGVREAIFHGHSVAEKETDKENILRYFQILDQGLRRILAEERTPLILAGVDYLLPIFRQASEYQYILEDQVVGNQEHLKDEEVRQQAWPIMQAYIEQEREALYARFHELASRDEASADLREVITSAHRGRVGTLFVATDAKEWGNFDPQTEQLSRTEEERPEIEDLLNLATVYAIAADSDVFADEQENLPRGQSLSAIFRY